MLSARDQENLVHAHQTTAAGKPLNHGVRALQPKTPGNLKTPFRAAKNDENRQFTLKGGKTIFNEGSSKLDKNAFITPAGELVADQKQVKQVLMAIGPRNRAPLGAKTTNAKAQPLKTPGPVPNTTKKDKSATKLSSSRRSARKITVAATGPRVETVTEQTVEDDGPDHGYAPPPIIELADPPIDFGYDQSFPQFRPENITKGYGEIYFGSPKDEAGVSIRLRQEEAERQQFRERQEQEIEDRIMRMSNQQTDPDAEIDAMIAAGPTSKQKHPIAESRVDTLKAKSAAALLSTSGSRLPAVTMKQTASSLQRQNKATSNMTSRSAGVLTRTLHFSSKAPLPVSSNTIGFPKAKKAPSIVPSGERLKNDHSRAAPLSQLSRSTINQNEIHPVEFVSLYGEPPVESEMWFKWQRYQQSQKEFHALFEDEGEDDLNKEFSDLDLSLNTVDPHGDFQLSMSED